MASFINNCNTAIESFFEIWMTWSCQVSLCSINTPRHLAQYTLSILKSFMVMFKLLSTLRSWRMFYLHWEIIYLMQTIYLTYKVHCSPDYIKHWLSSWLQHIFVSSANNMKFKIFETLLISFKYSIKNLGPRIGPWGTPHRTSSKPDLELLIWTYCFLLKR